MRDYEKELNTRVEDIRNIVNKANAKGIVFGNSGGKDSALVGILCKKASENTLGIMMPCQSKRNFNEDLDDARALAEKFSIETLVIDLTGVKEALLKTVTNEHEIIHDADINIAPRLRMTTLYAVAQSRGALVAGTGNRSERYMGYFTKWGDGAFDFNPISDLTVTEIYEFLSYLGAPENIIKKAPSAGLYEGQTDELEMGISYKQIDEYLLCGKGETDVIEKIEKAHNKSLHKQ